MSLRPYQQQALSNLRGSIAKGNRAPVLVMPTGSGKTHVATALIDSALGKGKRVLFLAPRRELIYQTSERMNHVLHGIIMAGEARSIMPDVQLACIPTLHRRLKDKRVSLPPADVLIVDEAHLAIAKSTRDVIEAYPGAVVIGMTATPARGDGAGLGTVFDDLVLGPSVKELTEQGYLVPARYFAGSKPDMSGVKVRGGDYDSEGLERAVNTEPLVGDVVSNWFRLASDRQTVIFCASRAHSRHLRERFSQHGIAVEHLDGETPKDERAGIIERLHLGETQIVTNVDVLTYGVDIAALSCAVLARPTKSVTRYLQGVGRILRPCEGKRDALVLDHALAVDELGFVDDERPWTLNDNIRKQSMNLTDKREPRAIECPKCQTQFRATRECPACGHEIPKATREKAMAYTEAELVEIDRAKNRRNREWTHDQKGRFYAELLHYGNTHGYKWGWAAMQYKTRLGVWPNAFKHVYPAPPSDETLAWIKSRLIAFAKAKEKSRAVG